jgi:hypothetical protein
MSYQLRVADNEAVGVVVDCEPETVHEPGVHEIDPRPGEWHTVRFATGRIALPVTLAFEGVALDALVDVVVTDPSAVWSDAPDLDRPILSTLELVLERALGDKPATTALTPALVEDAAPADWGLSVDAIAVKRWHVSQYDLETVDGQYVTIEVLTDATDRSETGHDETIAATLRDTVASATDSPGELAGLDAGALNDCLDDEEELFVRTIERTRDTRRDD